MRTPKEVFDDHLEKRRAGDVEGDIQTNYDENVILLTGTGIFRGHDGVRQSAKELAAYVKDASFVYTHTLVEEKYAFLEWQAEADDRKVSDGADSFVIENGKITVQTIHYTVDGK